VDEESNAAYDRLHVVARDHALTKSLHQSLEQLASSEANSALRDFAQDVLQGRMNLRDAALSSAYADALGDGVRQFLAWYNSLSENERAEQTAIGDEYLRSLREERDI
jgi:hypothetical protein